MKILFFAPHSAIWVHAFPEALVAESLRQGGHELVYVTCGNEFARACVAMSAAGLKHDATEDARRTVCARCNANKALIRREFGFRSFDIAEVLDESERAEAARLVSESRPENFLELKLDGIEIGRAALGTFLLLHKKISFDFSEQEWRIFTTELHNTLLSYFAARKVLDRERPDRLVVYSSGYSVNLVWCHAAAALGISHFYMNAGSNLSDRLSKVVLAKGHSLQKRLLWYWPTFRDRPCARKAMRYATDHFLEVLRGRSAFVYSSARRGNDQDMRQLFGIADGQKVLLATMSSYDELFAAESIGLFSSNYETPFADQIEWLQTLLDWVGKRPDLFLIIRVHPREFPNKRDSVLSEHARRLEKALVSLPPNVRVNWPADNLSLYDVAEITDVCLNAWSSVGKELSLLGIPVIIYSPDLVFYPEDLNYVGTSRVTYFSQIEAALRDGWSAERIRRTYRWLALEDLFSRIDISESYRYREHNTPSIPVRAIRRFRRMIDPLWKEKSDCRRRAPRLISAPLINQLLMEDKASILNILPIDHFETCSIEIEDKNLRDEVLRLMSGLYKNPLAPARPGTLKHHIQHFTRNN